MGFFFCFSYVRIFMALCVRIAGICWRHIALTIIDCILYSGFVFILGLLADFWICVYLVCVLFLGFCFLSELLESVVSLCSLV